MSAYRGALVILFTAILWWCLAALAAVPRVSFVRPPAYVSADAPVTLAIRVPPHAENRQLLVAVIDGEFLMSGTERNLRGEQSAALYNVTVHLPEGRLMLVAAVRSATAEVGRAVHVVTVIGSGPP